MRKLIIAHDLGTTGNKATLFSEEGKIIASQFFGYETYFPDALSAEQSAEDYWRAVVCSTRLLLAEGKAKKEDIGVISFSGQMMGALPVDKNGQPLHRILIWADRRGVEEIRWVKERIGEDRIYQLTGHRLSANYSLAKILWFRNHLPEIYNNTHKFLLAKDFVVFKLTGQWATDFSDASGTNLFDLTQETWSEEILEKVEIEEDKLPPLYSSTEIVGEVTKEAGEECGILPGTPVVIGGGDGPCAACGAGVVEEGEAYLYLGSSSWIAFASSQPFYDPEERTFTFHHLQKGLFMPTGTMQSAGGSYQWCRDTLCGREKILAQELGVSAYQLMDLEASKVPPGCGGLLFLPYLLGERAPWWNPHARGAFIGLTPSHGKSHLIRSVLEGVSFNLRIILDAFQEQGLHPDALRLIGGGARGNFWSHILAQVLGVEILRPRYVKEATSLGAAIAGGVGVGMFNGLEVAKKIVNIEDRFSPKEETVEVYNRLYPVFKKAYLSLLPVFDDLSSF